MGNHACRKPKKGTGIEIAMGPRALTASSGLAPWSMAVDRTSASVKENPTAPGVKGACPLGLPPPRGREGVTLAISTPVSKNSRGFLQSLHFPEMNGLTRSRRPDWRGTRIIRVSDLEVRKYTGKIAALVFLRVPMN